MGNTSSSNKISAQDRAILDLKIQRDKLQQYQKRIALLTDREKEIAKQCLARGEKKKALLALRNKKYQESLLQKTDAQLQQLQQLTSDVEFAQVQKDVVFGLQQGTSVLKQIHAEMGGIKNVEKILEDNAEARAYQKEISDMLAGQLSNSDEDEVEDELEAMDREVNGPVVEPDSKISLPDAPQADMPPLAAEQNEVQRARARAKARQEARKVEEPLAG